MWGDKKNSHIHVRVTEKADALISRLEEACETRKLRVNGGHVIDVTALLTCVYEHISHMSREKREGALISFLSSFPTLKTEDNEPVDIETIRLIAKELCI